MAPINANAPKPISFLTERSRDHFAEVLEYLEVFDIPYHIQDDFVGSEHYNTGTIFKFYINRGSSNEFESGDEDTLGYGERYDHLSKSARLGRKIPAVGITLDLQKKHESESITRYKQKRPDPIAYVVQVGPDARRGTFNIVERLRQANIPVAISFSEERLENQMRHAELLGVSALVIIGQKEISEGTAIIRNRNTHVQKIVSQNTLPSHLKRLCALY